MDQITEQTRFSPALLAFLLAPVLGELMSSSVPMPGFLIAWIPLALLYGTGALLCRELAFRWKTGWVGILLLGVAYGIYEEGLVARSFFDPEWKDLEGLGVYGRAIGVNWIWTELLTLFHAAVSIAATIAIVEMVFPHRRGEAWLGRRGMTWTGIGFGLWLPLGMVAFAETNNLHLVACAAVIALLVWAAARARSPLLPPREAHVPRPRRFLMVAFATTAFVFIWTFTTGEYGVPPAGVTAAVLVAVPALAGWVMLR